MGFGAHFLQGGLPEADSFPWTPVSVLVAAIGVVIGGAGLWQNRARKPSAVTPVDWQPELDSELSIFQLLDWRRRLVPLVGREEVKSNLLAWARRGGGTQVRFITGPGGAGKTRLAAEVADALAHDGWQTDFAKPDAASLLPESAHKRLMIVVDYPERDRSATRRLLEALKLPAEGGPVRALFVSRNSFESWKEDIDAAHARAICREHSLELQSLARE